MKLYEFQAKQVFQEHHIPVPKSMLIENDDALSSHIQTIGLPLVVKSQVLSGGRGKAGLISFCQTPEEVLHHVKRLFSHEVKINRLLLEEAVSIDQEIYVSITVDPATGYALLMASRAGGIDIEELARTQPEAILKKHIDLREGLQNYTATELAFELGFEGALVKSFIQIIKNLYDVFVTYDAELVEINPLFLTKDQTLIAGDGKLMIDDNSSDRQTRFEPTHEDYSSEAEYQASLEGIPFIQFDGDIGLMCAGAGLTTTVYDLINYEGGKVANYLEFGGPHYKKAYQALEICLKVPSKVILVVTFGTIARADVMAEGIVDAMKRLKPDRPIVTCIRGTNEQEATRILKEAGLEPLFDTEEAVKKAVLLSKGASL
jgi:succinyl-CoA synthetase beta subunit